MRRTALLFFSASLTATALAAGPLLEGELRWAPPLGATLAAEHGLEYELELADVSINVMGAEQAPEDMIDGFDFETYSPSGLLQLTTRDSHLRLPPGESSDGPLGFIRELGPLTLDDDPVEPLPEAVRIRFARDGEGEGWERFLLEDSDDFEGSEDEELAPLAEDIGYRWLVADGAAVEDSSWTVELDAQGLLDLIVGSVRVDGLETLVNAMANGDTVLETIAGNAAEHLEELAEEAEVTCTFVEFGASADGREVGRIALEFDHSGATDVSDYFLDTLAFSDGENDVAPDVVAELALALEGTGELLWDLENNCCAEFMLELDVEAELMVEFVADLGGMSIEADATMSWNGPIVRTVAGTLE